MSDIGTRMVDSLYGQLMVDDEWAVRSDRGFTWWGYRLAQHVEVSSPGKPAASNHPFSGLRPEMEDILNVPEHLVIPAGAEPSRFTGPFSEGLGAFAGDLSAPLLGAWCPDILSKQGNGLAFCCFLPNLIAQPGLLEDQIVYQAARAQFAPRQLPT